MVSSVRLAQSSQGKHSLPVEPLTGVTVKQKLPVRNGAWGCHCLPLCQFALLLGHVKA